MNKRSELKQGSDLSPCIYPDWFLLRLANRVLTDARQRQANSRVLYLTAPALDGGCHLPGDATLDTSSPSEERRSSEEQQPLSDSSSSFKPLVTPLLPQLEAELHQRRRVDSLVDASASARRRSHSVDAELRT